MFSSPCNLIFIKLYRTNKLVYCWVMGQKMALGHRLRYARLKRGLTQEQLADLIDDPKVKQSTIQQIEQRDSESSKYASKIANILKIPYSWLLDGTGADPFVSPTSTNVVNSPSVAYKIPENTNNQLIPITASIRMTEDGFTVDVNDLTPEYAVSVPYATNKTKVFQIYGGLMSRPLKDGWHVAVNENSKPSEGEPLLIQLTNESWVIGEFLFNREHSIEIDSYADRGRKTVLRVDILKFYPVSAILPPSQRIKT